MKTDNNKRENKYTIAYEPEQKIRQLLGDDFVCKDIFNAEKIRLCQQIIDEAKSTFFDSASVELDLLKMLVEAAQEARDVPESIFEQIADQAANIQGQARLFGFPFIVSVCTHIIGFCEESSQAADKRISVINKLVSALHLAFVKHIEDEGGTTERALLEDLKKKVKT